jgi:GAF domain-containing protein
MLPQPGQLLSLNQFVHDSAGALVGWKTLVTANRDRAFRWDQAATLPWGNVAQPIQESVMAGQPYQLNDLSHLTPQDISPELYSLFEANSIQSFLNIPMRIDGRPVASMSILSRSAVPFSADEINTFMNLGDQMSTLIYARTLLEDAQSAQSLAARLVQTNRAITQARSENEMAQAILEVVPASIHCLAVALFESPVESDTAAARLTTRTLASADGVVALETAEEGLPVPVEALPSLLQGTVLSLPVVGAALSMLPQGSRAYLHNRGAVFANVVGLRSGDRPLGLLALGSSEPLAAAQHDNIRALADQLAITLENRTLLVTTRQSLEETRLLYQTNQDILTAQDTLDILRALRANFAADAHSLSHLRVIYNEDRPVDLVTDTVISGDEERILISSLRDSLGAEQIARMVEFWNSAPSSMTMIESVADTAGAYPMAGILTGQGIGSVIDVLIRDGGKVMDVITVGFRLPQRFDERQQRLYAAVADQVGIVTQNHQLLREAQIGADRADQQVSQLRSINLLMGQMLSTTDEKSLMNLATETLVRLLGIDHSGIVLIDPDDPNLGHVVAEYPKHGAEGAPIDASNNPIWEEMKRRVPDPLVILDVEHDQRIEPLTREALRGLGAHSLALLPIIVRGTLIGGVGLDIYDRSRTIQVEMLDIGLIVTGQLNAALQNLRLLRNVRNTAFQLAQRVETLQKISQLERAISAAADEQTLLDVGTRGLYDLLQVDHCGVALIDPSGATAVVASEYPARGIAGQSSFPVAGNPVYELIGNAHEPVVIQSVDTDNRFSDLQRAPLQALEIKATLLIPLVVHNREGYVFTQDMIDLAQTVSSLIGTALQSVRLLDEVQRRAVQLQRVAEIGQSVQTSYDRQTILALMLEECSRMLPVNQISISLYDSQTEQLRVVANRDNEVSAVTLVNGAVVPIEGLVARVWESRETVYVPDLHALNNPIDPGVTLRSWLMVPMIARGRVLGMVGMGSSQSYAYSEGDIALFGQMVNQFATALENQDAYGRAQRSARNEALINDISSRLQRQFDVQSMLSITAQGLGQALGARRARIRLSNEFGTEDSESTTE